MWIRKRPVGPAPAAAGTPSQRLAEAVRQARVEMAEQSAVVVDLRDAELARLELLNEALDPLFKEIPAEVDMFDRGVSRGDTPRLWIDMIAHVHMGRDKRRYRFVQDTRYGRKLLAETSDAAEVADAIKHYVATRLVERERALADTANRAHERMGRDVEAIPAPRRRRSWSMVWTFAVGLILGFVAVIGALLFAASQAQ
jgi:hypothetical protein